MKDKRIEVSLVLVAVLSLLVIATMPASAQLHATVSIGNISLAPGATGTLQITITGAPNDVSSAQVDLTYNPNVVQVIAVGDSDFNAFYHNPNDGVVRMIGYQTGSLTAPVNFANVTLKAIGNPGDSTPLHLESDLQVLMGTGSPYEVGQDDGSASIIGAVPAYNIFGMIALIGLLAIVLAVTVRRR